MNSMTDRALPKRSLTTYPFAPGSGGTAFFRSMRLLQTLFCLLTACLISHGAVAAADAIRYGGDRDFRPFEFVDDAGRPQGFQIELLQALANVAGFEIDTRLDDWNTIESDFRAGRVDIVAMSHTSGRRAWALFASPHATPAMSIYHRRNTDAPLSLADLMQGTIAVPDSEAMNETRADFFAGDHYRFLTVKDHKAALEALRDGAADFALMPNAYGDPLLQTDAFGDLLASDFVLRLQNYGFAVAPGNEALRDKLNDALKTLEQSGRLDALRMRWLSSHRDAAVRTVLQARVVTQTVDLVLLGVGATGVLGWLLLRLRRRAAQTARERARRNEAEQALRRAQDRLAAAFTHHPDAMLITDYTSGRVLDVNDAMCRMAGVEPDALIGRPVDALSAFIDPEGLQTLRELMRADGEVSSTPLCLRRVDGDARCCLVSSEQFRSDTAREVFSIIRDVTDVLRDSNALRAAYDALAESAHRQAEALAAARVSLVRTEVELQSLTATISHDLSGPLRVIHGFTSMLKEDLQAGHFDKVLRHADRIDNVARRMDDIIDALIRLAGAAQQPMAPVRVDMAASAAQAWALLTDLGETTRISLRMTDLPAATGDEALLGQVWQNLLGNACKYSARSAEPRVAVDAFLEDGRQWYRVTDNGVGFDMDYARHLFEPFRRLHASSDFAGTGVGLSIVRRIVRRHGGEIRARGSVGVGAVFEFTLEKPVTSADGTGAETD